MKEPDLSEWNQRTVELIQASLGEIRPEIRMISLTHRDGLWVVTVTVDELDESLREDIEEDILTEFEVLVGKPDSMDGLIEVFKGQLRAPMLPGRAVYVRYEG